MGSGVVENWAVVVARLEPKMAISAPGAMAGRKLASLTMPAVVVAGTTWAVMVKASALEVPPSPVTVTLAVPAAAMRAAGTAAVNWEALTKVVVSGAPFHCTLELAGKLAPVSVRVKAAPPGAAELGLRLAREAVGVAAFTVNRGACGETISPGLTTWMACWPAVAMALAGTLTVSWFRLT